MKHTTKLIHSLGCFSLLHYAYSIIEISTPPTTQTNSTSTIPN